MSLPEDAPAPRLCHIVQWADFDGYGFNLHADKSRPGQYVGKIDEGSPAEMAGLKEHDRIIEVNGVNIFGETHKQVVQRIKAVSDETRLLVADPETEQWYTERKMMIRGDQDNVVFGSSRKKSISSSQSSSPASLNGDRASVTGHDTDPAAVDRDTQDTRSVSSSASIHSSNNANQESLKTPSTSPPESPLPVKQLSDMKVSDSQSLNSEGTDDYTALQNSKNANLGFNMSATEMRAHLASKKKFDPRKDVIDLKKKHQIIQNM